MKCSKCGWQIKYGKCGCKVKLKVDVPRKFDEEGDTTFCKTCHKIIVYRSGVWRHQRAEKHPAKPDWR